VHETLTSRSAWPGAQGLVESPAGVKFEVVSMRAAATGRSTQRALHYVLRQMCTPVFHSRHRSSADLRRAFRRISPRKSAHPRPLPALHGCSRESYSRRRSRWAERARAAHYRHEFL